MCIPTGTKYTPGFLPPQEEEEGWALAFAGKKLLLAPGRGGSGRRIPTTEELRRIPGILGPGIYIGRYDGSRCYCMEAREEPALPLPAGIEAAGLREVTALTGDPGLFLLAGTAHHILHWDRMNRFCGRCGHPTEDKGDERAKVCPACGNVIYPRISPATITAVFRGDRILLAHNRGFAGNLHSLIAGFVEPGETLEQCAAREIGEEVGIEVRNLRYFSSQPWPFPDSLMTAFTAEYAGGEIKVDGDEITRAAWFDAGSLPEIPGADSIAGKIIRWYLKGRPRA